MVTLQCYGQSGWQLYVWCWRCLPGVGCAVVSVLELGALCMSWGQSQGWGGGVYLFDFMHSFAIEFLRWKEGSSLGRGGGGHSSACAAQSCVHHLSQWGWVLGPTAGAGGCSGGCSGHPWDAAGLLLLSLHVVSAQLFPAGSSITSSPCCWFRLVVPLGPVGGHPLCLPQLWVWQSSATIHLWPGHVAGVVSKDILTG